MKKELIRLLALCLAICLGICAVPVSAAVTGGVTEEDGDISVPINPDDGKEEPPEEYVDQGFCGEDALWILNDQGTLMISGSGVMFDYSAAGSAPWYAYRDEIKAVTVEGDVTAVSAGAFAQCANLESIFLGVAVTDVDSAAILGCDGLNRFAVHDSNPAFSGDPSGALYSKDKTMLVRCPTGYSGSFAINAQVTQISAGAFNGCSALSGIQVAAENAHFASDSRGVLFNKTMTGLVRVPQRLSGHYLIPETVTQIQPDAFADCTALTGITVQAGVAQIGADAFAGCSALAQVRYCSSQEQWEQITIGGGNEPLTDASREYNTPAYLPGDFDLSGEVSDADALYLLRHTLFADRYPIVMDGDVDKSGDVTDADALYLLRHTLFPSRYPLYPEK